MKQLVIIGIIIILVTVGLSGCNEINNTVDPDKNNFIGTWQNTTRNITSVHNNTLILFSNGSLSFKNFSGTWDIKDGKLLIEITTGKGFGNFIYNYMFSNDDRTLTLTNSLDSSTVVWTKQ